MNFSSRVQEAMERTAVLHDGQYRKGKKIPYVIHPIAVMLIASTATDDEDVLIAALLHDILEDVAGYREADMREEFGDRVTDIVKGVTEPKDPNKGAEEKLPWHECKKQYMETLRNASEESVMVAAADKIHNLESLLVMYEEYGEETWHIFNSTAEDRVWYFKEVLAIIRERLDNELVNRFDELFEQLHNRVIQSS